MGVALCLLSVVLLLVPAARWPPALASVGGPLTLSLLGFLVQARVAADTGRSVGVTCLLSSLALGLFAASLPARWRSRGVFAGAVLVLLLAWVDQLHLRGLGSVVPLTSPSIARQAWGALPSVPSLLRGRDVVWLVAALGALALRAAPPSRGGWGWAVPAALALGWAAQRASAGQLERAPVRDGFLTIHAVDLVRVVQRQERRRHRTEALTEAQAALTRREPTSEVPAAWRRPGASVLLIQLESFNAWAVGLELDGQRVTPVLDALARESIWYPGAIAQVSRGRSSDADLLVQASLHPLREGVAAFDVDPGTLATLPRELRARGYTTFSALADSPGFWDARARHEGYGFETSLFADALGPGPRIGFGLADHLMFERVAPRIAALPRPYLAWLITLSTHHPFRPLAPEHRGLRLGDLAETSLGHYLETVHYVDASVGSLLRALADEGALADTIVAIYADHDEQNFENPARLRAMADSRAPGHPDSHRRIPLLIRLPGPPTHARVDEPTGLIDLAPTLLSMLEIERPRAFLGRPRFAGVSAPVRRHDGLVMSPDGWAWHHGCTLPAGCAEARAALESELHLSQSIALLGLGPALGSTPTAAR